MMLTVNWQRESRMIDFKRQKTLSKKFGRIAINENDIYRVAKIMQKLPEKFGGELKISVVTGDREETIRTSDIEIFVSEELPNFLSSIIINYSNYEAPVSCSVTLPSASLNYAEIEIDGTDTDIVAATFHELEREIKSKTASLSTLYLFSEKGFLPFLVIHLLTGALCAAAIYSIFDIPLDFIHRSNPHFKETQLYKSISALGGICVSLALFGGFFVFDTIVKKSFPPIEFTGRLADPSKIPRRRITFLILMVIIPILVNVTSDLILEIIQRPS